MRSHRRYALIIGVIGFLILVVYLRNVRGPHIGKPPRESLPRDTQEEEDVEHLHKNKRAKINFPRDEIAPLEQKCLSDVKSVNCIVNGKSRSGCLTAQGEGYVPFSWVKSYFEIFGSVSGKGIVWEHSNARLHRLAPTYQNTGPFMFFDQYDVEKRDRVMLITPDEGIPLSTQWDKRGYPYPIQIAQFGLSHWSRKLIGREKEKRSDLLPPQVRWNIPQGGKFEQQEADKDDERPKVLFDTTQTTGGIELPVSVAISTYLKKEHRRPYPLLVVTGLWSPGSALTVRLIWGQMDAVHLIYACSMPDQSSGHLQNNYLSVNEDHTRVVYWMRECANQREGAGGWSVHMVRDLRLDMEKSYPRKKRKEVRRWKLKAVTSISLSGAGELTSLYLTTSARIDRFVFAADWFLRHQDDQGGWSVPVARRLRGEKKLDPGWYSAMGQGHGISILVRAHNLTRNRRYLEAAERATALFHKEASAGGVLAHFLTSDLPWYEEYPTTPGLYVLNGFIYSLVGLHDLSVSSPTSDAGKLYQAGMVTLRRLLPLFDTGSGSLYDLRHWSGTGVSSLGPNRARWDYHSTHISQLQLLAQIDPEEPLWLETARRWSGYMLGARSPHN